eukprot:TRINITY_DN6479_c1_g1_i1.p1 TRINITY_DN6479_c1_g1~~TRINITY_DN6479_c1_g1_i1.p1  ORF type:complete len:437 (+),score=112.62 TRINITY_DN6479_c1_g1_i1:172-1482(+)
MQTLGGFGVAVAGFGVLLSFDGLRERSIGLLRQDQLLATEPWSTSPALQQLSALSCHHVSGDSLAEGSKEPAGSDGRWWCCGGYPQGSSSALDEGRHQLPSAVALLEAVLSTAADSSSGSCSDDSETTDSLAHWFRRLLASLLLASSRSSRATLVLGLAMLFVALLEFAICGWLALSLGRWLQSRWLRRRASVPKQEDSDPTQASVQQVQYIPSTVPPRRPEFFTMSSREEVDSEEEFSPRAWLSTENAEKLAAANERIQELEAIKVELAAANERIQELELLQQKAAVAVEPHQVPEETTQKAALEDHVPPENTGGQGAEEPRPPPSPPQPPAEDVLTFEQFQTADKEKVLSQELTVAHKQVDETLAENQVLRRQLADAHAFCAEQKQAFSKQIEEKESAMQALSVDAQQKLSQNAQENGKLRRELETLRKQRRWL